MEWSKRDIKKRVKWLCKEYKVAYKLEFATYCVLLSMGYRNIERYKRLPLRRLENGQYRGHLNLEEIESNIVKMMKEAR